jgi:predicted DNA-binding protein
MKTSIRINSALERGTTEGGTEDLEDYRLASATMERVRSGKEKVSTWTSQNFQQLLAGAEARRSFWDAHGTTEVVPFHV